MKNEIGSVGPDLETRRRNAGAPRHRASKTWIFLLALISTVTFFSSNVEVPAQGLYPYKNPNLGVDERVADLLSRMTTEEKARQLDMYFGCEALLEKGQYTARTHAKPDADFNVQMAEKNLGTLGVGSIHDLYPRARLSNRIQAWVIK